MCARSAVITPVESNFILPVRCYPNGYTDVYGDKHDGPHCLKYDGDGTIVPAAAYGENAHQAFEGNDNGRKPKPVSEQIKLLQETATLLKGVFGRHGWRDHASGNARLCVVLVCASDLRATEFGITPAFADIIEHIMEAEDKLQSSKGSDL
jgi:hypothetical protein